MIQDWKSPHWALGAILCFFMATSSQAAPLQKCWKLDLSEAADVPFLLPEEICIDRADVEWDLGSATHHLTLTGTPYSGDFALHEYGEESPYSTMVEATLKEDRISSPGCFRQSSVAINFRFEITLDAAEILNSKVWALYTEADASCRTIRMLGISYLPVESI